MAPAPETGQAQALRRQLMVRIVIALAVFGVLIAGLQWVERGLQESLAPQRKAEPSSAPIAQPPAPTTAAPEVTPPAEAGVTAGTPTEAAPAAPTAEPQPGVAASGPPEGASPESTPVGRPPRMEAAGPVDTPQPSAGRGQPRGTTSSHGTAPLVAKPITPAKAGPHLQAGVFLQASNAEALKAKLEAEGLPVYVETRVLVGPFKDREEADVAREKLKAMGVATVLIGK